jgi:hypothetical protein
MSCAAGPENRSQLCVGISPNVQGYRCNYCWGVVERYSRTKQTIAARRLSVSNMLDVKKAHEIQRGWSLRAQIIVQDLLIEMLNRRSVKPQKFALVMCGSIQRKEACPFSDVDCFALVEKEEYVGIVKLAAEDTQNQLEVVGTYWEGEDSRGSAMRIYDGFHFCHGGLSPEKMCATPEGMIDYIDGESEANSHILDALGGTFVYGKRSLFEDFAKRARVFKDENGPNSVKRKALESLYKYLEAENKDKPYRLEENKEFTIIKDRLYRPAQQVIKCVAQYYGIIDVETRSQLQKLAAQGHTSTQVNTFLDTYLNHVARLRLKNHMKWGREYEIIYFKIPAQPKTEEAELIRQKKFPLTEGAEKLQVQKLMYASEAVRGLGNEFYRQKSKRGLLAYKKNPFMTNSPLEYV